jgi:hypothetical protein
MKLDCLNLDVEHWSYRLTCKFIEAPRFLLPRQRSPRKHNGLLPARSASSQSASSEPYHPALLLSLLHCSSVFLDNA